MNALLFTEFLFPNEVPNPSSGRNTLGYANTVTNLKGEGGYKRNRTALESKLTFNWYLG